jgi:CBS domain-containing protein
MKVEDVMIEMGSFPAVTKKTILKEALTEMGEANLGLVCIINDKQ